MYPVHWCYQIPSFPNHGKKLDSLIRNVLLSVGRRAEELMKKNTSLQPGTTQYRIKVMWTDGFRMLPYTLPRISCCLTAAARRWRYWSSKSQLSHGSLTSTQAAQQSSRILSLLLNRHAKMLLSEKLTFSHWFRLFISATVLSYQFESHLKKVSRA